MFAAVLTSLILLLSGAPAVAAKSAPAQPAPAAAKAEADRLYALADGEADPVKAVAAWEKALPAIKAAYPAGSPQRGLAGANFGRALNNAGRPADGVALLAAAVEILEKAGPNYRSGLADALADLGSIETGLGRLSAAEGHLRRAIEINLALGPDRRAREASARFDLGFVTSLRGDHEGAIELMRASMATREAVLPPSDPDRIINRMALGGTLGLAGRYDEAEKHVRGAVDDAHRWLTPTHPVTCLALETLAAFLIEQGRANEALAPAARAVEIRRSLGGPRESLGYALGTLGRVQSASGDLAAAEQSFEEANQIFAEVFGAETRTVAQTDLNLASAESGLGKHAEALAHRRHAMEVMEKQGGDDYLMASAYVSRALSQHYLKDYKAARADAARASELFARVRPATDAVRLGAEVTLAQEEAWSGDAAAALARADRAVAGLETSLRRRYEGRRQRREAGALQAAFGQALDVAYLAGDIESGFRFGQLVLQADGGQGLAQTNAALAEGTGRLAELLRERRRTLLLRADAEGLYLKSVGKDAAAAATARDNLTRLDGEVDRIDAAITAEFPEHAVLERPRPLTIAEAQARLGPGEALVLPIVFDDRIITFSISRNRAAWTRTETAWKEISELTRRVRGSVNPVAGRAAIDAGGAGRLSLGTPFDRRAAYRLYTLIFRPEIEAVLKGADTYVVSASGVLNSIPLSLLVTAPPKGDDADPAALRATPWLIRRAALQMTLFVTALRPQGEARGSGGFVGFGAPKLEGAAATASVDAYYQGSEVDQTALKNLAPLPGAEREVKALAALFRSAGSRVFLGEQATEATVKAMDFRDARVVAFATHGLLAGDIGGLAQPGLVFSPPREASALDDGVLTVTEVVGLKLNADLVILSACDMGADDRTGALGYRFMAQAFMLAGARSLMVSHWPVRDDAAARLSVETARGAQRGVSPARALRRAVLDLMNDPSFASSADPAVWAAFSIVGR
jgi:CHAT domain-containing protein/tetratricopeptide (TPR) repeat protein